MEESSSGAGSTDTGAADSTSTGMVEVGCEDGEVEIEGDCLVPLSVTASIYRASPLETLEGERPTCSTVGCSGGESPFAGGFFTSEVRLEASHAGAMADTWEVCGVGNPTAASQLQAVANCTEAEGSIHESETTATIAAFDSDCVEHMCPAGTVAVGGGGSWGPQPQLTVTSSRPTDTGWRICGRTAEVAADVTIEVRCAVLAGDATRTQVEASELVPNNETGCATATCPANSVMVAGGGGVGPGLDLTSSFPEPASPLEWRSCGASGGGGGSEVFSWAVCVSP